MEYADALIRWLRALAAAPPPMADWQDVPPRRFAGNGCSVDVIVPVYRGYAETLCAIRQVLAARCATPHRLVVIDDASPDARLRRQLDALAGRGLFELLRNEANRGFVATANRGMRLSANDVVLLNADTEVFDGWLDRLRAAAYSSADYATATPLSNAATILSYPIPLRDNRKPPGLSPKQLDRIAAALGAAPIEIPTAIGFCMYVKRAALDHAGLFDEAAFGRGYGEENDFCMRARKLGWRHAAAADTFVWHWSGRSFGGSRKRRIAQAMRTMRRLHPEYAGIIADFIAADPIAPARASLDAARARALATDRLC